MDLLGEDLAGNLYHFELQSTNDPKINLRMAEYVIGTYRITGRFPTQFVLYVGEAPLAMPSELSGPDVSIRYQLIDFRSIDGEELLASPDLGDNILAILAGLQDQKAAVRAIVAKIARQPEAVRSVAVQQLIVLAGLRSLVQTVKEEVSKMPVYIDIMKNEIIGPAIRSGIEEGLKQGLEKGRQEGEQRLFRTLLEQRFGPLPAWADAKLASLSTAEIEALAHRFSEATSLENLLR